jgi:hypothetical protein
MNPEADSKALEVLACALESTSRITRLRAVSMLARFECPERGRWLDRACRDADEGVRSAAVAVCAWVAVPDEPCLPDRENPAFDAIPRIVDPIIALEATASGNRSWEYSVEVWRHDGLLVGVFLSALCNEDDEHAKRIALGQAILASAGPGGDSFDPERAAAFIVGKRTVGRTARSNGHDPESRSP